jgi:outer membrane protein assembly factor BamB
VVSQVESSPAVSKDGTTIFVGSNDNKVYALDVLTGAKKWEFQTGAWVTSSPAISKDGTTIYVGSNDNKVYALDAVTGAKKWEFATNWWGSSPAISQDGTTIYVGSNYDGNVYVYAIDSVNGTKKWAFETGDFVFSSLRLSQDGTTIYVGSEDKNVYAIDTGFVLTTTTTTTTPMPTTTTNTPTLTTTTTTTTPTPTTTTNTPTPTTTPSTTICDGNTSPFSVAGTVLCVSNTIYPSSNVSHCVLEKTWKELRMEGVFHTGGLGKLMTVNEYEVWVCISDHPCVEDENDMVCFTYNEKKTVFVP